MASRRIFIYAVALGVLCIIAVFVLHLQFRFIDYSEATFAESTEELSNPYVGWYDIQLFRLSDTTPLDLSFFDSREYNPSLVLLEIDLQNYRETPLSARAEEQLHTLLSRCRAGGLQAIMRFMYDSEGDHPENEPSNISLILTHMTQSARIINQYTDCVYILQGLFVGSWGELHTSNYTGSADLLRLAAHLNTVVDPSVFLAVRTPEQWRIITGLAQPYDLTDGSLAARLSLFNDGMLGSETDLGTYADPGADSVGGVGKYEREAEIAFQDVLCEYVPNGGEVVIDNPRNDLPAALDYLRQAHVSYLNRGYDPDVLSKWETTIYGGSDVYGGMNGYAYIERHLGYRYAVRSAELIFPHPWRAAAIIAVHVDNTGFAPAYRTFDVTLTLEDPVTGEEYSIPADSDTRRWAPGTETRVEIPIAVRTVSPGTYDLVLHLHDPATGLKVSFANETDDSDGVYLGSLRIRQFPNL